MASKKVDAIDTIAGQARVGMTPCLAGALEARGIETFLISRRADQNIHRLQAALLGAWDRRGVRTCRYHR